ncbi:MAG TPA: riboflavin synthase [Armatimonadota bacterium]|nr:riboflavin synthase [Armatimonadota bacterium]HOP80321.1 riboflavin synthase [Armatimonadota bacterium]HPP74637.1 riboflavin synthase [Armatimonadota bacterium]
MFTGLVEEVGTVKSIVRGAGAEIKVSAPLVSVGTAVGDSIAINGVCLTVTKISGDELSFDAVEETLSRSSLGNLRSGSLVNLERSVSANRLFGGHFVLGHVDGLGNIVSFDKRPGETTLVIQAPEQIMRYVVQKGSIAIDGISLTVASCDDNQFSVAVIPHTIASTNLKSRRVGDIVNLEADIIGKYVEKFVAARSASKGLTTQLLADAGFLEE